MRVLVQAPAIIGHFNHHAAGFVIRIQPQATRLGLPAVGAGCLDAMVDGIAHQVGQRIGQLVHHGLVQLGVAPLTNRRMSLPSAWLTSCTTRQSG
jgi:hypothetical protein